MVLLDITDYTYRFWPSYEFSFVYKTSNVPFVSIRQNPFQDKPQMFIGGKNVLSIETAFMD